VEAEFFVHAPLGGDGQVLAGARVGAAAVGPVQGPQAFFGCALLNQQATLGSNRNTEKARCRMPSPSWALALGHQTQFVVVFVDQDQ
jgi:hypothetical protein